MVKFPQAALIVSKNELAVIDLVTGAKLEGFGSDVCNSPASIVISNYCRKGYQGILNPPTFAAVQGDRAMLNIWSWARTKPISRFVLPEKLTSLTVSGSGEFFVGGGASGKLYIWEADSDLLQTINAHAGAINVIKFTSDDRYFVTGGEDGSVLSWSLQVCADPDRDPGSISPYRVYSGHTLGISDICLSSGLYQHAIFFTASLDGKCKIWNLLTGELLNTVSMPSPITSVICNNATTQIALGCENGVIYFSDLSSCDTAPVKTSVLPHSLQAHGAKVSCLGLSLDGSLFASGSEDGKTILWNFEARKLIFEVNFNTGPVYKVLIILRPPNLAQHGMATLKCSPLEWVPWKIRKDASRTPKILNTPEMYYDQSQVFAPLPLSGLTEDSNFLSTAPYSGTILSDRLYRQDKGSKMSPQSALGGDAASSGRIANYKNAVGDLMREIESSNER